MSLARQFAAVGQQATAAFEEELCTVLRTGKTFMAKIQPLGDAALNELAGVDPRATDMFHVRDRSMAGQILANDVIQALGRKFLLVPKTAPDNPTTLHLEYTAIVGVPGTDDWA